MSLFQKFLNFLKKLIYVQEEPVETEVSFEESAKPKESAVEYRLNLGKKTLLTRLYTIEQKITVFETEFPKEFQEFTRRINILKEDYQEIRLLLNNLPEREKEIIMMHYGFYEDKIYRNEDRRKFKKGFGGRKRGAK